MKNLLISVSDSIKDSLKTMDKESRKVLYVVDENNKLLGALSDGDIRRAILKGCQLTDTIESYMNPKPVYATQETGAERLKELMIENEIQSIPVIDNAGAVVEVQFWHELFASKETAYPSIDIPLVVMAGGFGTRLEPVTKVLPKPLIPIEDKTIIEIIFDEYEKFGVKDIYLTVNYKANLIQAYFEYSEKDYDIKFVHEDKPLGTAGSLKYIEDKIKTDFFVSNCDIIIHEDYGKIYDFHKKGDFDLTLVASLKHHVIPYGVCEIEEGGTLSRINEKPEYDFFVNTGMYVLKSEVLKYIPKDTFYHITHLIADLQKSGKKIGVFPVSEKAWLDVGQWSEYKKSLDFFSANH